jgi:putative peptidoglycan lipid II flippase
MRCWPGGSSARSSPRPRWPARSTSFREALDGFFAGSTGRRLIGVAALVGVGGIVYFAVGWVIGAINREDVLILLRKKKVA